MSTVAALLIPLTLFTLMLALGLGLPADALVHWRQHWRLLLRAELATCLVVPLIGWGLLCTPPAQALSTEARHAIALMAACPSAPLILRKAGKNGGDHALAALLQVGAALAAIVTVPLLASLGEWLFGVEGWDVLPRQVALQVGQVQLLPLLLGVVLRRRFPGSVERALGPLDRLANSLLILLVVAVLVKTAPLLLGFGAGNLGSLALMAVLVLLCLLLGCGVAGEGRERRITTALVMAMRNPGLALLLASTYAPQLPAVKLGVLIYVLITVVISAPLLRLLR